ncbi:hypothetical protein GQ602_001969 [Ophiocordyceps camponoti-floridani]|uniref:Uncharacterized protein n=1 Tax=Ophiocordyceps camponoti-floridani TaxID=2030778 RepID=A0A8H4VEV4_9HYPO|nr:hypothetical protein GQ602_001969 [Ophiocordyceps camponoti-floridani]
MSRVTAPVINLSRAISTSSSSGAASRPLRDASSSGAALMPKYAELLRNRQAPDASRSLTTAHRPTPNPPSPTDQSP